MILIVNVLLLLLGLLLAPAPPIYPFWPQPQPLLQAVEQEPMRRRSSAPTHGAPVSQFLLVSNQSLSQDAATVVDDDRLLLYHRVAARSLGEGSFALAEIACTIKNRLRVSRAPLSVVLRAYHAADVPPAAVHLDIVRQVFEGQLPCPETWWYALSLQDTYHWRPHQRPPAKTIKQNERKQILIFDR